MVQPVFDAHGIKHDIHIEDCVEPIFVRRETMRVQGLGKIREHAFVHSFGSLVVVRVLFCYRDEGVYSLMHVDCEPRRIRYATVMRKVQSLGLQAHDPVDRLVRLRGVEVYRRCRREYEFAAGCIEFPV